MPEPKQEMLYNRLQKMHRHLGKQARKQGVTCWRVYDHDIPEFPLCIELYENHIYVAEYKRRHGLTDDEHEEWLALTIQTISRFFNAPEEKIFYKTRQRKEGRQGQYQKTGEDNREVTVHESGLQFIVNLGDYLDTGLFLDHRLTRQMVREQSTEKRVLNLFAYTGSFSVYAAAGAADYIQTIDLSNTYLDWARRNMELNGFGSSSKYAFIQADVLHHLKTLPLQSFDLIILDPPTFSNSKRMKDFLDIQQDHVWLINQCMNLLTPGGRLYFSTNHRKFKLDGPAIFSREIKDITRQTTPFDFEGRLFRSCFLLEK